MPRDRRRARQRRAALPEGPTAAIDGAPIEQLGRPEPLDEELGSAEPLDEELELGDDADLDYGDELDDDDQRQLAPSRRAATARRPRSRVATFLRGSWLELHRVQWPDRRQVTQATAVVLGFVIIAGTYLGLMDALFQRVVNFILK